MTNRVLAEYETPLSLNGDLVMINSRKIRWSGDKKAGELPGIWLNTCVSSNRGEIYRGEREITTEFRGYAKLKHGQIVRKVKTCDSLEEISSAVREIF